MTLTKAALYNQQHLVEIFGRHHQRLTQALSETERQQVVHLILDHYTPTDQAELDWVAVTSAIYQAVEQTPALRDQLISNDEAFTQTLGLHGAKEKADELSTTEDLNKHAAAVKNVVVNCDISESEITTTPPPTLIRKFFNRLLGVNSHG